MKIGIPRALFYYHFYALWKVFLESLGFDIIISPKTNKKILEKGIDLTVDDACLPVKLYHGHVAELANRVDVLFLPRIVSIQPKEYICPKFLGLPDMVKCNIPGLPFVVDTEFNLYKGYVHLFNHFLEVGMLLGKSRFQITKSFLNALISYKKYKRNIRQGQLLPIDVLNFVENRQTMNIMNIQTMLDTANKCELKVLLLGHPYNLYDDYINMNLIGKLKKLKIKIITYEMLSENSIKRSEKFLSKPLFWTLGKNILGSAYYFLEHEYIDGIIHVASFGCGPDSLVGELLERKVIRDYQIPFLYLNLDEQTGEAGFNTRLEAFIDILEGRKYIENYISTYG